MKRLTPGVCLLAATLALSAGTATVAVAHDRQHAPARADHHHRAAQTVVGVAAGNADFSTLVTAVQTAGLVDTLNSTGPFTVFAPTNDAFAGLPAGTVDSLLRPSRRAALSRILTYHVVPRKLASNQMLAGPFHVRMLKSTPDRTLAITKGAGGVTVDNAKVVTADIMTDNGIIHVIDSVMLPSK